MDHTPEHPAADGPPEPEDTVIETVREKLIRRTCEWCGKEISPRAKGKGRKRRYCSPAHRQRAYEVRTARERQERDQEAGLARREEEPVREVIERTVVRTRLVPASPWERPGMRSGGQLYPGIEPNPEPEHQEDPGVRPRELQRILVRTAAAIAQGQMSIREVERIMRGVDAVRSAGDRFYDQLGSGKRH
ncbi:hypothetical protein [Nocardiopsis ganjiahuensis]|uniref:hypothetical protein n=1 Tax=Nocardiopsis ganjiahuensis TaxID=239984 RepID=UPI000377915B|nr:hypothetical protein [Nocardiopsis ganjiahuensis]